MHVKPIDKSLLQNVKEFIKKNIDLLPREILIRQKQIHFWWTQIGQG